MKEKAYNKAAQTIITYENPIYSHEDIKDLKGIGKSIYSKLKEYVEFEALKNEQNKIDNLIIQLQDYLIARQPDSELSVLKSVLKEVLVK